MAVGEEADRSQRFACECCASHLGDAFADALARGHRRARRAARSALRKAALERKNIAIVGAGAAGSYCADALARARPDMKIALYEMNDHPGGRLRSIRLSGDTIEAGGMFVGENHHNVMRLVERFGLRKRAVIWRRKNYYLRGRLLTDDAFADPGAVPYELWEGERGKSPWDLMFYALSLIAPAIGTLWPFAESGPYATLEGAAEYLRSLEVGGMPLCDWDIWHLIERYISHEAYELLSAALGNTSALRGNALEAILTLIWEAQPRQRHYLLDDGYQQLPATLVRAACEAGAQFLPGRRLTRITTLSDGFRLHFQKEDGEHWVEADEVILALPKAAIEGIELDEALAGGQFYRDLDAVSPVPACKILLGFEDAWWRNGETAADQSGEHEILALYTDLQIKLCFYPANGDHAIVTAAYADEAAAQFWSDFLDDGGFAAPGSHGGDGGMLPLPAAMVETVRRHLQCLHPGVTVPAPCSAMLCGWSGAWHLWRPRRRSWEVRRRIRRPNPKLRLFVCGEAFAQFNGWTESALNDAEATLSEHFGLPKAEWVQSDHLFEA